MGFLINRSKRAQEQPIEAVPLNHSELVAVASTLMGRPGCCAALPGKSLVVGRASDISTNRPAIPHRPILGFPSLVAYEEEGQNGLRIWCVRILATEPAKTPKGPDVWGDLYASVGSSQPFGDWVRTQVNHETGLFEINEGGVSDRLLPIEVDVAYVQDVLKLLETSKRDEGNILFGGLVAALSFSKPVREHFEVSSLKQDICRVTGKTVAPARRSLKLFLLVSFLEELIDGASIFDPNQ